MMTRVDFQVFAEVIRVITANDYAQDRADKANLVADVLAETNPRFDRAKFLVACGVTT
jgi:hypothetical protein